MDDGSAERFQVLVGKYGGGFLILGDLERNLVFSFPAVANRRHPVVHSLPGGKCPLDKDHETGAEAGAQRRGEAHPRSLERRKKGRGACAGGGGATEMLRVRN